MLMKTDGQFPLEKDKNQTSSTGHPSLCTGLGVTHIVCSVEERPEVTERLQEQKGREKRPFVTVSSYCYSVVGITNDGGSGTSA